MVVGLVALRDEVAIISNHLDGVAAFCGCPVEVYEDGGPWRDVGNELLPNLAAVDEERHAYVPPGAGVGCSLVLDVGCELHVVAGLWCVDVPGDVGHCEIGSTQSDLRLCTWNGIPIPMELRPGRIVVVEIQVRDAHHIHRAKRLRLGR